MSDSAKGKKESRAARVPEQGRRATVTFRCLPDLQGKIQQAAATSGRSISEEIERRLENSFSKELAQLREYMFGDAKTEAMLSKIVQMSKFIENWYSSIKGNPPAAWHEDELMRAAMRKAAQHIIIAATPHGLDKVADIPSPPQALEDGTYPVVVPTETVPRPIAEAQHYGLFAAQVLTGNFNLSEENYVDFEPQVKNLGMGTQNEG